MSENEGNLLSIEDLEGIILDRKANMPKDSYVASLLIGEIDRSAQKVGEEATEFAIAATRMGITGEGEAKVIGEAADLTFHLVLALARLNIPWLRIKEELTRRHVEKTRQNQT